MRLTLSGISIRTPERCSFDSRSTRPAGKDRYLPQARDSLTVRPFDSGRTVDRPIGSNPSRGGGDMAPSSRREFMTRAAAAVTALVAGPLRPGGRPPPLDAATTGNTALPRP